jgi:hypothetical protein
MSSITIEEARTRVILQNPGYTSDQVRKEADRLIRELDFLASMDETRAQFAAQQAEDDRRQAITAQRRAEAVSDASSIVRRSHPDWGSDSVEREAQRLVAENERATAELRLRDTLEPSDG